MDVTVIKYLYQPSIVIEVAILLSVLCFFTRPQYLTALMATLLLLRPNERFECIVSYPKIIYPILALSILFYSDKTTRIKQLKLDKQLLIFILVIIIETLIYHSSNLVDNLSFIAVGLTLYYAIVLFSSDQKGAMLLSYAIVASCFIICGEAAYYHYYEPIGSINWSFFHVGPKEIARLQAWGNWGNANETAFIACIGITNVVFQCVRNGNKILYVVSSALIPFFLLVIYLTASRAGLATIVLFFLPMVVLLDFKAGKIIVVLVVVAVLFFSSSFTPQRVDLEGSRDERLDLRYGGIHLFKQYPIFGIGFQQSTYELGGMPLHNTYLQALVETGVIGASLLLYYVCKIGHRIYLAILHNKHNKFSNSNVTVVAGLYLGSSFYFLWGNQLLSLLFFLCMAQINVGMQLVEKDHAIICQ